MKAAIYCRLSKEDEGKTGESESIQNQKSMLIQYAAEQGYEIVGIYSDEDYSGMDRDRPAFNAMIQAASEHRFDLVLAKTQSRFTRDMELVEKYLHGKFIEWGIRFVAVVDHVDTDDRASKKSRQINGLVNEWYLEDLSGNVRSVLDHKRREGQYIASFALYGYRKDPAAKGKLQMDPEEAAVVRRIFALALGGMGARKIARTLNREGVPSPAACKQRQGIRCRTGGHPPLWSDATIHQMLRNRTYAGDLVQGRHKKISYKSKKTVWLPKSQWIVVPGTHQGIIDRETFDTVQQMLQKRARSGRSGAVHPLAGKVYCGCCGSTLEQTGTGGGRGGVRRRYLRCRLHQRAPERCSNQTCTDLDALEEAVLERMRAYAGMWFDPEKMAFSPADQETGRQTRAKQEELRRLQQEIGRRRAALESLYLDKASGLVEPEVFGQMQQHFLQETKEAQSRVRRLEAELSRPREDSGAANWKEQARELAKMPELTRELVSLLVDRVVVWPKDPETGIQNIRMEWNF